MSATELDGFDARIADLKARFDSLPEADRLAIEARFDRLNPRPEGSHPGIWRLTRRLACLDILEGSGPIMVVAATRSSGTEPATIRDPSPDPPRPRPTPKQRQEFLDDLGAEDVARFEACSPERQDELVRANVTGVIGGERIGRKPAEVPSPDPGPILDLELAWIP